MGWQYGWWSEEGGRGRGGSFKNKKIIKIKVLSSFLLGLDVSLFIYLCSFIPFNCIIYPIIYSFILGGNKGV